MATKRIAFLLKGYPRLSETFIAQEIRALEQRGLDILIVSLRHPTDPGTHPVHEEIRSKVWYLPEYLHDEPGRVARAVAGARRLPGYAAARKAWLRDLVRDLTRNRARRFGQALVLARELQGEVHHIHAHFLHTPASVARYASALLNIPWSCSAHAKDIWLTPDWEKREKLAACAWVTTCTRFGATHLRDFAADPSVVKLNYHGLDLRRFPPPDTIRPPRDGGDPEQPVLILSVGRAVAKKGYDDLLRALSSLAPALHWEFVHIGDGEELAALKKLGNRLELSARIRWLGALPQQQVLQWYRRADVFVLACRVGADGDRDGLPNVLLEALSQRLAILSTKMSGIPELIEHAVHGLTVPPRDIGLLSFELNRLITNPELRTRLGEAGFRRVHNQFSLETHINHIAAQFNLREASAA